MKIMRPRSAMAASPGEGGGAAAWTGSLARANASKESKNSLQPRVRSFMLVGRAAIEMPVRRVRLGQPLDGVDETLHLVVSLHCIHDQFDR